MSAAKWTDTYGIQHWRILRSSYRKLAWVGFEPTTTEFHSDALTNWAIRSWVQLALRANFVQLLQFHLSVQCSCFILAIAFITCHICFKRHLTQVITWVQWNELIHMVYNTEGFLEVAVESWPEWDLNSWPLNSVRCSHQLSYQAMSSTCTQSQLCTATPISSLCSVFTFHFGHCLRQLPHLL